MKTAKELINEKQKEIGVLRAKLQEEANEKFKHLIGRCFKLSGTSIFKVENIDYVNDETVECSGLHIYGNIKYANDFNIEKFGSGRLFIEEQNNEITKDQFLEIMNTWYNEQKENVTASFL